jgi:ATP-dependent DNA helicase RecQ
LSSDDQQLLREVFGFSEYRNGQSQVISRLLAGDSVLAIFPTGGGKSLCYQLPALILDGLTLVISPLIALMKDQLDFLVSKGAPAARLDSTLGREATLAVYEQMHAGSLKLLYVSPERLNNERFLHALRRRQISLLAVDEAHCISEWGHNFRPDYLKISRLSRQLRVQRTLALTATATPQVAEDICQGFGIAQENVVHTGFYRANLRLVVTACEGLQRDQLLRQRLERQPKGATIVYVTLQRTAERVAEMLASQGFDAKAYHAGMDKDDRDAVQDAFMASGTMIVVATIAFGMGVDKADIRYVYHYNLPKCLESYTQEIGRAGRDGETSICELFACKDDMVVLQNFSYGDTPTVQGIKSLLNDIFARGDPFDISIYELTSTHDIRELVVKTLLTYLELDGILRPTGPFYTELKFQPQKTSREILETFDAARADFLRDVFRHARKGTKWWSLDVQAIAELLGESRNRIMAALSFLEERGDLVVQAAGLREGYRRQKLPSDLSSLTKSLAKRFQHREAQDIARLQRVVQYAEQAGCLTRHLLEYFGEQHENCGHCSRCEGQAATPLPPPSYRSPDQRDAAELVSLRREGHAALGTSRQLARFLCGLASPATTRARLRKHPLFGKLAEVPFQEVLRWIEQQGI